MLDLVGGNLVEGFFAGEDLRVSELLFGVQDSNELVGHRGAAEEIAGRVMWFMNSSASASSPGAKLT